MPVSQLTARLFSSVFVLVKGAILILQLKQYAADQTPEATGWAVSTLHINIQGHYQRADKRLDVYTELYQSAVTYCHEAAGCHLSLQRRIIHPHLR